jgi:hypothetical protein
MTPQLSHQRVAWAWLDKMLDRAPSGQAPTLSPRAQAVVLERTYEQLRDGLIASLQAEIAPLVRAEETIATKYGLDPTFLDWFLINGKHWPSMSSRHRRALRAIQSLFIWFGAVPNQWSHMVIPEVDQGDDRDAALIELADWFLKNTLVHVQQRFVGAVWKKSRELTGVFGGSQPGDPKASALLLADFTQRLTADAFQRKPAVQQIVDLMH